MKTVREYPGTRAHFIGVGGIGMSALARILQTKGIKISGSDSNESVLTKLMSEAGVNVSYGAAATNVEEVDFVVHSLAIAPTHPELEEAKRRKIPTFTYPEAVGVLTQSHYTIAICGTHGKTTVTAMIAKVLIENNFDPTVIVGTTLKELDGLNFRVGKKPILILESCEYMRAFLSYQPQVIILNTLDPDHLDYYKDFNDYRQAFEEFIQKLPQDGYLFANLDDEDIQDVLKFVETKKAVPRYNIFTYGSLHPSGTYYIDGEVIKKGDNTLATLSLGIPGAHNRMNALAAFGVAHTLGVPANTIVKNLSDFHGSGRRFEIAGMLGETTIVDDYGHHPVEIEATLQAAREKFPNGKICVVFQPHQYSRTKKLFLDFVSAFKMADHVIIPNIYEVRDSSEDLKSTSPEELVKGIDKDHHSVTYGDGLKNTAKELINIHKEYRAIILMGAGDVWKIRAMLPLGKS